jgi:hypothetical protein
MFQLIRAGITGGKTVPASVADNPLVFVTLTARSFGRVHGLRDHGGSCHPRFGKLRLCAHGRPVSCHARHGEDDPALGQPLCPDFYDYNSHVVWQFCARTCGSGSPSGCAAWSLTCSGCLSPV